MPPVPSLHRGLVSPTRKPPGAPGPAPGLLTTPLSSVVPTGKSASVVLNGFAPLKSTPFARTVIPAPSKAPMSEGSCKSSPRLPFKVASQPMVPSRGNLSTCGELGWARKVRAFQPASGQLYTPAGSYGADPLDAEYGTPCSVKPNRQLICRRQGSSSLPAGVALALMMVEAAPAPCRRTGFHINNISL